MQDSIVELIQEITTQTSEGFPRHEASSKQVYADVKSISSAEFFRAGQDNIKPQYKMTIYSSEYEGEKIVKYENQTYSVYRTYQATNDFIELYVEQKAGTSNG